MGLADCDGSAPLATAMAAASATAGVEEAGADRESSVKVDCEERCAGGDCPRGCPQALVTEVEVDPNDDRLGFPPLFNRNRSVPGTCQYVGKVFRADNQDRDGP